MPVTVAHTVAAIALRRPLGRAGVLSALVIGSITPDVPLFLPFPMPRNVSHGFQGLLTFCLPAGILIYFVYRQVVAQPLRDLGPPAIQRRLPWPWMPPPAVWTWPVLLSLVVGALTHLVWDNFTHGGAPVVRLLPALETRLFTVSGYTAYVFSVLQHASSAGGTLALALWGWYWYRHAPQVSRVAGGGLSPPARRLVLVAIAGVVLIAVVIGSVDRLPAQLTLRALQPFVRRIIVAMLSSAAASLLVYAAAWHLWRRRPGGAR
jgi:hypothetical protein